MRGYCAIGLSNPKDSSNIASALRAAGIFNVAMVAATGKRYGRHSADTMRAYRHLPLLQVPDLRAVLPYDCIAVAVEIVESATPLPEYTHPERAFYIFGAEDQTLGSATLDWCRDVVFIPTRRCLNLAACVNVVLYDRCAKRNEWAFEASPCAEQSDAS